ncbi:MAG: hypothetical protein FJZ56_07435 [Chlamydiae bacterium]|nr:hypothetical protein [Chlamydiota bacterium]
MKKILRISAAILILIGIALFPLAGYIADQVTDGQGQISSGQQKVDTLRGASSLSPYTKDVGNFFADSGQRKIDAGKKEVAKYEKVIKDLRIGGTIAILLGGVLFLVSFLPQKRSSK